MVWPVNSHSIEEVPHFPYLEMPRLHPKVEQALLHSLNIYADLINEMTNNDRTKEHFFGTILIRIVKDISEATGYEFVESDRT